MRVQLEIASHFIRNMLFYALRKRALPLQHEDIVKVFDKFECLLLDELWQIYIMHGKTRFNFDFRMRLRFKCNCTNEDGYNLPKTVEQVLQTLNLNHSYFRLITLLPAEGVLDINQNEIVMYYKRCHSDVGRIFELYSSYSAQMYPYNFVKKCNYNNVVETQLNYIHENETLVNF